MTETETNKMRLEEALGDLEKMQQAHHNLLKKHLRLKRDYEQACTMIGKLKLENVSTATLAARMKIL